jgi:hypothetical protein
MEITIDDIRQMEKRNGITLPSHYADFLVDFGLTGLATEAIVSRLADPSTPIGGIDVFYGIVGRPDFYDLETQWKSGHPDGLLPIARAASGHICISLAGANRGTVYFWLKDVLEGEFVDPYSAIEAVGGDFSQFMDLLVPESSD